MVLLYVFSRHCARPTLRQRSSSGNCTLMVCVANPDHGNRSHEGVFFSIVMFCVQPFSRPTSRQRSSTAAVAENAGRWFAVVTPTRYSRRSFFHFVTATAIYSFFKPLGDGRGHLDLGWASGWDHRGSGQVGGSTKASKLRADSAKTLTTHSGMAAATFLSDKKTQRHGSNHLS